MLKLFCRGLCHFASCLLVSEASKSLPFFCSPIPALLLPPYPLLHLSFYFKFPGRSGRNFPLSLSSVIFFFAILLPLLGYNWSPDTCFSWEATRLMTWPGVECYSCLLLFIVVSLLLFLVYSFIFFRAGGILFYLNSLTHRLPRFLLRSLCFLVTLAVPFPFCCNGYSLLISSYALQLAELKVLHVAHADTRPWTPLVSFCIVHLRVFGTVRFLATLCFLTISGLGGCPASGALWFSTMPPFLRRIQATTTT